MHFIDSTQGARVTTEVTKRIHLLVSFSFNVKELVLNL